MPDSTPETRREAFEFANAICALAGLYPTPEATARNERIISGEITIEQGIALAVEAAKARAAASRRPAMPQLQQDPSMTEPTRLALSDPTPADSTPEQRRFDLEQAIASGKIDGFEPDAAFLADCEAVIAGTMTHDQACAAALARALAADAEADRLDAERAAPGSSAS